MQGLIHITGYLKIRIERVQSRIERVHSLCSLSPRLCSHSTPLLLPYYDATAYVQTLSQKVT